ncbi:DUF2268 domain-containing protein [Bacillus massiliglaciei]|uniref:DUF2268 domain-containing protein n=1 Tax=Bacillus massiliglaciei TaxID=1816693 RepID=UPI000DA606F9|nr:DUF2268 domain-containing putative Zn-dependent protease [Bacillus massiliglaciei]
MMNQVMFMGIINTYDWFEKGGGPSRITEKLNSFFKEEEKPETIIPYLKQHGLYLPGSLLRTKRWLDHSVWGKLEDIFSRYKGLWRGPDIPIFILPFSPGQKAANKSGVAFADKLFLFLSPSVSEKQMEAIFIHEYHHVCRLNRAMNRKRQEELNFLDSIVMEGLAEQMVKRFLGESYTAGWTSLYEETEMRKQWKKYVEPNLFLKRSDPKHDELLFGKGKYPRMLGYAAGYYLIGQSGRLRVKESFELPSEAFLQGEHENEKPLYKEE